MFYRHEQKKEPTMKIRTATRWSVAVMLTTSALLAACSDDSSSTSAATTGAAATTTAITAAPTPTTASAPSTTAVEAIPVPTVSGIEVQTGINDPKDPNVAVLQYMPAKVTVPVNTPVRWTWAGTIEPHSVTFLAPGVKLPPPGSDTSWFVPKPATGAYDGTTTASSGLLPLGPAPVKPLEMTFSKPGTYSYVCVIHPNMQGTVEVVDATAKVDTAQEVAQRRVTEEAQWLAEGRAIKAKLAATPVKSAPNPNGTTTWTVLMGASGPHTDVLAFSPTPAGVKKGDTVTFLNNSGAPHTASFFGTGAEVITNPIDPRVDKPAPGASPQTLSPAGFFNTGLLPPDAPPGSGPPEAARSFTFKVDQAGTYSYVCILHSPSSMIGRIVAS
ncbi:MAG: hypothetical protein JWL70_2919 [Acidimicrobiia bacterium]|nr:hypothetical protein [Acidimicrobiia bacterium]